MKSIFFILCFVCWYTAAESAEDDLFYMGISATVTPGSPLPPAGGQILSDGIQSGIAGYSLVGSLLGQAAMERRGRYMPSQAPQGFSNDQVQHFRSHHQKQLQKTQEAFQQKVSQTFAVPQEIKNSIEEENAKWKAVLETVQNIKIPEPAIHRPATADTAKEPDLGLSTHYLSTEGKEIRRVIHLALKLEASGHREFIISSATRADRLFPSKAGQRWVERANSAYTYWTNQPGKARLMTESLNEGAKRAFGLDAISADTFERYEIIRAAKLLSFESGLSHNDELRLQASLSLKQALLYANDGETDLVVQMTENVYAIKDFLKGFAGGIKQNIFDTASGMWQTVTHPVDSVEALAYAVTNYRATFDAISNRFHQVIEEYPTYSPEQKGDLFGKIAGELGTIVFPAGTIKYVNKAVRLEKAVEHLAEKMASSQASNIANARRLADQLRLESARSPFTETGRLTEATIKDSWEFIKASELKNPAIPSGFGKYWTDTFQSPAGEFRVHFYKHSADGRICYDLDYKVVFNIPFGQR